MKPGRHTQGFTLIELMTVMIIIGMLSAIALPNFMNAISRARVARSTSDQELIRLALEMYVLDQEAYPPNQTVGESAQTDLSAITSPIPYLSELPYDAFLSPPGQIDSAFIQGPREGHYSYFYVNYLQDLGQRKNLESFGISGSANYTIYGLGPSFDFDINPYSPAQFIRYSPSNGIKSQGVISTFGP